MTKKEMAREIAKEMNLPQMVVMEFIDRLFDKIIGSLEKKGRIEFRRFGVFEVRIRRPRKGRNPHTGDTVMVPARSVAKFTPGSEMERRVAQIQTPPITES